MGQHTGRRHRQGRARIGRIDTDRLRDRLRVAADDAARHIKAAGDQHALRHQQQVAWRRVRHRRIRASTRVGSPASSNPSYTPRMSGDPTVKNRKRRIFKRGEARKEFRL